MSKEPKELKVTDKRMFTAAGELREEYSFLNTKATPESEAAPSAGEPIPSVDEEVPVEALYDEPEAEMEKGPDAYREERGNARVEFPSMPPGLGPTFFDLVSMLAEPAALYLGDLALPDGESAENLEMALLHIEILDVLRQKTSGNLSGQEASYLEDLLYRLRVRYVQKSR